MSEPLVEGEVIAQLHASFENMTLSARKDGYSIRFFVDLEEAAEVIKLNEAIQRIVVLTVTRRSRRTPDSPHTPDFLIYPEAWQGSE